MKTLSLRHSRKEIWRTISLYPQYQASTHGNIRYTDTHEPKKTYLHRNTYRKVTLQRDRWLVHQLILITFEGLRPPQYTLIRHLDSNPLNNHLSNLRYGTHKENRADYLKQARHEH